MCGSQEEEEGLRSKVNAACVFLQFICMWLYSSMLKVHNMIVSVCVCVRVQLCAGGSAGCCCIAGRRVSGN